VLPFNLPSLASAGSSGAFAGQANPLLLLVLESTDRWGHLRPLGTTGTRRLCARPNLRVVRSVNQCLSAGNERSGWDTTALHPGLFARRFCLSHPSPRARRMGHPNVRSRASLDRKTGAAVVSGHASETWVSRGNNPLQGRSACVRTRFCLGGQLYGFRKSSVL